MTLGELLKGVEVVAVAGNLDTPVTGLHYDSRKIGPGFAFIAVRGEKTDGNLYAASAIERGAAAIISETQPDMPPRSYAHVQVRDARKVLALAGANFYGHPSCAIRIAGITGTNGKTTTSFLIESIFHTAGKRAGLFGTIEYHLPGRRVAAPNTTPESLDLQAYLAELRAEGATHAVMEVSSHALALERVYGCAFQTAVFTNLTRDHLDFHGTMEAYFAEKRKLFAGVGAPPPEWAVLNADDPFSEQLADCGVANILWYGLSERAEVRPVAARSQPASGCFAADTPWGPLELASPLLGRPNVYNLLAASAAGLAMGFSIDEVQRGVSALANVPGRFERVEAGQPFLVVVDYAHTDDALQNLARTARGLLRGGPVSGRVITLFGCGGDRDRTKRPLMGEVAGSLSDFVVVTSDNPRTEDPVAIIDDILPGLKRTAAPYVVEPDRAKAIALAIREARPGDIVLIAGKGHEDYQVIGATKSHFDDREVARAVLRELGYEKALSK